jgi:membrane protein YdbS with pleckstrin-like domain
MKLFEKKDLAREFLPDLHKVISQHRVKIILLVAVNVAVYLRTVYYKSWRSMIIYNILVALFLFAYLYYRLSLWLYDKVKTDPENKSHNYR